MDTWDCNFAERSPMLAPLRAVALALKGDTWPSLSRLNALAQRYGVVSGGGQPLRFMSAAEQALPKASDYEQRIHDEGVVTLRECNWHDFFNALAWLTFPLIKKALNRGHVEELNLQTAAERFSRTATARNRRRDALTLFDESGVLVFSSSTAVLDGIRAFAWRQVFWEEREQFQAATQCLIVGHALYEKALSSYLGMTGHALLMVGRADSRSNAGLDRRQDERAANALRDHIRQPHDLSPLPVLGVPGWWDANREVAFYENTAYFRAGRSRKPSTPQGNQPGRISAD